MNSDLVERVAEIIKANTRMVRGCEAKGDCPHCARDIKKAAAAVLAELAGELRDAERYRWLRTSEYWDWPIVVLGYSDYEVAQGEELDKAIDEARHG